MRFFRILLNPLGDGGGGTPPGSPPPPAAPAPPPGSPPGNPPNASGQTAPNPTPPPPPAPTIALSLDEYQRLRSVETEHNQFRTLKEQEIAAKEQERIRALFDKGQVDQALKATEDRYKTQLEEATSKYIELEKNVFAEKKQSELTTALVGRVLAGSTPEVQAAVRDQLLAVIGDRFETVRDASNALVVRHKMTGRPAGDVLKELLDSPSFDIYFAPNSRGGAGATGSSTTAPPPGSPPKPGSLEHIAAEFKARQAKYGSIGLYAQSKSPANVSNPWIR